MLKIFEAILTSFKKALYPQRIKCIICDAEIEKENKYSICKDCFEHLPLNNNKVCFRCGERIDDLSNYCNNCRNNTERYFDKARAPLLYTDSIKTLIHNMKFNYKKYIARYLSYFLVDEYKKQGFDVDIIVPIPISKKRLKEREYNQSKELCYAFEKELGLLIDTENFIKSIDTPHQTDLTKKERQENLKGSFEVVNKKVFKGKKVLIIDDVYTTGSTMEEASCIIRKAGAKEIYCLSVAHTIPMNMRTDK